MRVLLVDDHAVVRRGLKQILIEEFRDAVLGEASDAGSALDLVRREPWDLVMLDVTMPGRSGLEVLGDIKQLRPDLPVLVLSMHAEDQFAIRMLRAGAVGYVTKDNAPEALVGAVRKALEGGRYVSEYLAEQLVFELQHDAGKPVHETLSDREFEVLRLIASGQTVTHIARDLSLSVKTVSTYRMRLLEKMRISSNAELTRYALLHGLLD
jgi:two-component system, NarL family, invasion response regulator UvrY